MAGTIDNTNGALPIGIIGAGSIGRYVADAILQGDVKGAVLTAVSDICPPPDDFLARLKSRSVAFVDRFEQLTRFPVKLVVECANQEAARQCSDYFISRGIDLVIMSVGALVDGNFLSQLSSTAGEKGCRIYVPSGAIGAIDAIRAANVHGLEAVVLTTRKPPGSLGPVDGVDLENLTEPTVIYRGSATEAVKKFPKNVNVAAALSLAGLGPERTTVCVVADPGIDRNIHEIKVKGAFGSFKIRLSNNPSPKNPKTSYLACMSVVSLLKKILSPIQIGG
jgi:aspartate dehydrogenase